MLWDFVQLSYVCVNFWPWWCRFGKGFTTRCFSRDTTDPCANVSSGIRGLINLASLRSDQSERVGKRLEQSRLYIFLVAFLVLQCTWYVVHNMSAQERAATCYTRSRHCAGNWQQLQTTVPSLPSILTKQQLESVASWHRCISLAPN